MSDDYSSEDSSEVVITVFLPLSGYEFPKIHMYADRTVGALKAELIKMSKRISTTEHLAEEEIQQGKFVFNRTHVVDDDYKKLCEVLDLSESKKRKHEACDVSCEFLVCSRSSSAS